MATTARAGDGVISGPVIGFVSGWGLFELSERRKVRLAQRELRQAVVAELEHAEVLLSSIIGKHARLADSPEQVETVAREMRWFSDVGALRGRDTGVFLPGPAPASLKGLSDQQIVDFFASSPRKEIFGVKLVFPVVDSILEGRTAGFRADEIKRLAAIKWQAHLLEQDADWTRQFLILSFTIADETDRLATIANRESSLREYFQRAIVLQRCVRAGLGAIRQPGNASRRIRETSVTSGGR